MSAKIINHFKRDKILQKFHLNEENLGNIPFKLSIESLDS